MKTYHLCAYAFLMVILVACGSHPARLTVTDEVAATPLSLSLPTVIPVTPTANPLSLPIPTISILPMLTPATPARSSTAYHLVSETADQADEIITGMEQAVLAFWDVPPSTGNLHPPYRAVWYAAWDALAHFPDDPRADKWRWKMAYFMALSGEGGEATQIYADQIANALNQQGIKPQDLPNWFQSGELNPTYITPSFTLELDQIQVPGNDAGYLVIIGKLDDIDTPGGTCMLVVENENKFTPYVIHNGFPGFGFFITLRNPINCFTIDVTDDGVDEIIVDQYTGGHVGTTNVSVFDVTSLPPKVMPFTPLQDTKLAVWNGRILDYLKTHGKTQIQIGAPLGFCDEYGISSYQWNGKWFEVSMGRVELGQSPNLSDDTLFNCSGRIMEYVRDLDSQDAISVLDEAFKTYFPNIHNNLEELEEFRVSKGLHSAFIGDQESARSVFNEIANSPTVSNSVWIKPAQDFLKVYETSADLYRACSTVNIRVSYYEQYTDQDSVNIRLCDYDAALQATVATALSSSPLAQITDDLKFAEVHISSEGWHDFDGDGRDERWFTVIQPGETESELWIGAEYSQGVKVLLVGHLPNQNLHFKPVKGDPQGILTDFGFGKTIELVRHPSTEEPFVVVRDVDTVDPIEQELAKFIELRQLLYSGSAAAPIYERLLEINGKYHNCPFENKDEYGAIVSSYDCANYYYTLAFAAELAGKEKDAVKRYYDVWNMFPESLFAVMARLKLEQ